MSVHLQCLENLMWERESTTKIKYSKIIHYKCGFWTYTMLYSCVKHENEYLKTLENKLFEKLHFRWVQREPFKEKSRKCTGCASPNTKILEMSCQGYWSIIIQMALCNHACGSVLICSFGFLFLSQVNRYFISFYFCPILGMPSANLYSFCTDL